MAVSAPRNQHRPDSSDLMIERIGRRPILQVILGLVVFIVAEGLGALLAQMIGGDTGTGVGGVIGALLALGGYLLLMRFIAERSPLEFARRGALCELGAGVLIGTALMCAVVGAAALAGAYRVVGFNARAALFGFAGLSIMAGVAEEILFRGLLLRILEHRIGTWWALGLTSVLFGGVHFINPEATLMGAVAIALEAGLLLGACFILTRRLWLVIGVHAAWNFVQGGVFSSDVSGTGSGGIGLLSASIDGPAALTGGDMGFEGSLSAVVVCLACAIIVLLLARRRGLILPGMRRRSS
ncbi:lysostaphin resistance A-like protein [Schaalia sp.]|uniref:CPBP family intramembrane glutamic endopeptidase n=1 Tax=Schaalia sp. TaxID=2691890 RepID=UPI003D0E8A67